jgi:prophage antirepressor-like protein
MSIGLRQFTFLKKKKDISLVRRKTTYKFIERSNVEAPTQLQIWTNGKIDPSMRENDPALAAPEVKIAILTTSHLYLINSKSCKLERKDTR